MQETRKQTDKTGRSGGRVACLLSSSLSGRHVFGITRRCCRPPGSTPGGGRTGDDSVRMSPTKGLGRMQPRPPTGPRGWMQRTPVLLFGIVLLVLVLLFLIATLTRS